MTSNEDNMMQTRKVVINTCFGGFGLSDLATVAIAERKRIKVDDLHVYDLARDDYDLVAVVEGLGEKANDTYSALKVVEIPADVQWDIAEYDGLEHIAERHRTWS
jgi:hypothetical protein